MPHRAVPPALALTPDEQDQLQAVQEHLARHIRQRDGFMPFDEWMSHVLYAPGLGYYAAGAGKLSAAAHSGDFTTAPELTPLFGQALAGQVAQILAASQSNEILEFGAGTGALAAALIPALKLLGMTPRYRILEVSADLRARQRLKLADVGADVTWLDALPSAFEGCVLANEVLDAMPVTLFHWDAEGRLGEVGVALAEDGPVQYAPDLPASPFRFAERRADDPLRDSVMRRMPILPGYRSEINFQAEAWLRQMGGWLRKGAALLIDYGFPRQEYYHPQRMEGTLMCHFRHRAHAHPLVLAGLQDITAHVDFSAMAQAARDGGLEVLGYATQARFLMNAGLTELLSGLDPSDAQAYSRAIGPVQRLLSEAEMGELFKFMAVGRGVDAPLMGFLRGDRRGRLADD